MPNAQTDTLPPPPAYSRDGGDDTPPARQGDLAAIGVLAVLASGAVVGLTLRFGFFLFGGV